MTTVPKKTILTLPTVKNKNNGRSSSSSSSFSDGGIMLLDGGIMLLDGFIQVHRITLIVSSFMLLLRR